VCEKFLAAEVQHITLSDFVREVVAQWLNHNGNPSHTVTQMVELLKEQLHTKDEQISQLHQLVGMDRQERKRLAHQLDRAHAQIEDQNQHRGWWRVWRKREGGSASDCCCFFFANVLSLNDFNS